MFYISIFNISLPYKSYWLIQREKQIGQIWNVIIFKKAHQKFICFGGSFVKRISQPD